MRQVFAPNDTCRFFLRRKRHQRWSLRNLNAPDKKKAAGDEPAASLFPL